MAVPISDRQVRADSIRTCPNIFFQTKQGSDAEKNSRQIHCVIGSAGGDVRVDERAGVCRGRRRQTGKNRCGGHLRSAERRVHAKHRRHPLAGGFQRDGFAQRVIWPRGRKRPICMTIALIDRFLGVKELLPLIEESAKASER